MMTNRAHLLNVHHVWLQLDSSCLDEAIKVLVFDLLQNVCHRSILILSALPYLHIVKESIVLSSAGLHLSGEWSDLGRI